MPTFGMVPAGSSPYFFELAGGINWRPTIDKIYKWDYLYSSELLYLNLEFNFLKK